MSVLTWKSQTPWTLRNVIQIDATTAWVHCEEKRQKFNVSLFQTTAWSCREKISCDFNCPECSLTCLCQNLFWVSAFVLVWGQKRFVRQKGFAHQFALNVNALVLWEFVNKLECCTIVSQPGKDSNCSWCCKCVGIITWFCLVRSVTV